MKIKTAEATELQLDWLVAKCEGALVPLGNVKLIGTQLFIGVGGDYAYGDYQVPYAPSSDWSQGGPIINRIGGFELKNWLEAEPETRCEAHIHNYEGDWIAFGPTSLIAAMRCYVASKLGEEVEVPDELA